MNKLIKVLLSTVMTMAVVFSVNAAMDEDSIRDRLKPVGKVCVEGDDCGTAAAAVASGPKSAKEIYDTSCAACHGTGAMGAPKFGDAATWADRSAKGVDALIANAISGVNAMPPKGTCMSCSDDEIAATVNYILENSK
ncbi:MULTISPECIES: cytochrome c5 family protein [unclassified Oleiphilus]|nr:MULTISPECIES: c-type cytochrome [unclassified Oleiphilus]